MRNNMRMALRTPGSSSTRRTRWPEVSAEGCAVIGNVSALPFVSPVAVGNSNAKTEPFPGVDMTSISRSSRRAMRWTMDRPSPYPSRELLGVTPI
jgi:hypothetical protein